jgi:putative two-component system response regulator
MSGVIRSFNENKTVARLSELLALTMGAPPAKARQIRAAAALHDIGKQKIPKSILNKPGELSAREFEIMKNHTLLGAEMLTSIQDDLGAIAVKIALFHHEHWDGNGYWGVPCRCLPDYVSITAICDVFTALTAKRCYKDAWPPNEALAYIQNQSGTQFSGELVGVFIPLIRNDERVSDIFKRWG